MRADMLTRRTQPAVRAASLLLERLGHHDFLDFPGKDSTQSVVQDRRALGLRRLFTFGAVHHESLSRALTALPSGGSRALALRGRLLRLLGDGAGARRALAASLAASASAQAAGWLGELSIFDEPRRALKSLERAVALDKAWPWPRLWMAAALLQLRKTIAARVELDAFLRLSRRRPYILTLLRFQLHMIKRDERSALGLAHAAIRLDPACPAGYEAAARALLALGRRSAATTRTHDARDRDFDVIGAYALEVPGRALNWEDRAASLGALDAAIAQCPRLAALYALRAELKRDPQFCRYNEALKDYARAVRLEPRRAWLRAVYARAKNNLHGAGAGLKDFNRAVKLCPVSGWIRAWRGALLARLGRESEALADFESAQRLMPWYSFTYAWRGALFNRLKRFAAARRDLEIAIRLDPSYTFSVYERFRALLGLKDYAPALRDLNAAFAVDPKYVWDRSDLAGLDAAVKARPELSWLHGWRGYCLLEMNRAAEALSCFNRAMIQERGSGLLFAWRGRALQAVGRTAAAKADLKYAQRLSPELWTVHQTSADIHEECGEPGQALSSIAAAVRLAPTTISFLLTKARLELSLGSCDDAFSSVGRALELDASSVDARRLKARAYLIRSLSWRKTADAHKRIADFNHALKLAPELLSPAQRRTVSELTMTTE